MLASSETDAFGNPPRPQTYSSSLFLRDGSSHTLNVSSSFGATLLP
jgi:hypothetical protein